MAGVWFSSLFGGVVMESVAERREAKRAERLEEMRLQIARGELVVRRATARDFEVLDAACARRERRVVPVELLRAERLGRRRVGRELAGEVIA